MNQQCFTPKVFGLLHGLAEKYGTSLNYGAGYFIGIMSAVCQDKFEIEIPDGYLSDSKLPLTTFTVTLVPWGEQFTKIYQILMKPIISFRSSHSDINQYCSIINSLNYNELSEYINYCNANCISLISTDDNILYEVKNNKKFCQRLISGYNQDEKQCIDYKNSTYKYFLQPLISISICTKKFPMLLDYGLWAEGFYNLCIPILTNRYTYEKIFNDDYLIENLDYYNKKIDDILKLTKISTYNSQKITLFFADNSLYYIDEYKNYIGSRFFSGKFHKTWLFSSENLIYKIAALFYIYENVIDLKGRNTISDQYVKAAYSFIKYCGNYLFRIINWANKPQLDVINQVVICLNKFILDNNELKDSFSVANISSRIHIDTITTQSALNFLVKQNYIGIHSAQPHLSG